MDSQHRTAILMSLALNGEYHPAWTGGVAAKLHLHTGIMGWSEPEGWIDYLDTTTTTLSSEDEVGGEQRQTLFMNVERPPEAKVELPWCLQEAFGAKAEAASEGGSAVFLRSQSASSLLLSDWIIA